MTNEERSTGTPESLAWRRLGEGPPLVLINGYAATKDDWDPSFLAALATRSTVICPDNRGVGESVRGSGEISIESMAADVDRLLDEMELDRFDLAGWSMGGFIAQTLAGTRPERIRSLTLLGTDPGGEHASIASAEVWSSLTDKSGSPEEQARRLVDLLFPRPFADQVFQVAGELVAAAKAALDPQVLAEQEQAMIGWRRLPDHPLQRMVREDSLGFPVLAACGAEDRVIPAANTLAIGRIVPGAWVAPFAGGGHAFMAQEPDRLATLVSAFAGRSVPAGAGSGS